MAKLELVIGISFGDAGADHLSWIRRVRSFGVVELRLHDGPIGDGGSHHRKEPRPPGTRWYQLPVDRTAAEERRSG